MSGNCDLDWGDGIREGGILPCFSPESHENPLPTPSTHTYLPTHHFLLNLGFLGRDVGTAGANLGEKEAGEVGQSFPENTI